jgi:acid stress chaperone HdeB
MKLDDHVMHRTNTFTTKIACTVLIAAAVVAASAYKAKAQLILDMSLLKCSDYLTSDPERQELIAAWMSGYYNSARNQPTVDLTRFATNKKNVEQYCKRNKKENLMNAIQKVAF